MKEYLFLQYTKLFVFLGKHLFQYTSICCNKSGDFALQFSQVSHWYLSNTEIWEEVKSKRFLVEMVNVILCLCMLFKEYFYIYITFGRVNSGSSTAPPVCFQDTDLQADSMRPLYETLLVFMTTFLAPCY